MTPGEKIAEEWRKEWNHFWEWTAKKGQGVDLAQRLDAALAAARAEGAREAFAEAARIAYDEAHGHMLHAGSIGLGGSTREHVILSAQSSTAREIGNAIDTAARRREG